MRQINDSVRSADVADRQQSSSVLQPIGETTKTVQVLHALQNAIADGTLEAGSVHSIADLATQLGVSRTPVHEALLRLMKWDLVRMEPGRGVRILGTSGHDVEDIFQLRMWLEPSATSEAVPALNQNRRGEMQRLRDAFTTMIDAAKEHDAPTFWRGDRDFHSIILTASGNTRLANYVDSLRELTRLRDAVTEALLANGIWPTAVAHKPILDAIEAANPAEAAAAMHKHIRDTADAVEHTRRRRRRPLEMQ